MAIQDVADVHCSDRIVGSRLHWTVFLAPNEGFKTAAPFLLAAALLIPTLAMLGLYQGGRRVVHDSGTAQWKAENLSPRQVGTAAEQNIIDSIVDYFLIGYVGLIGFVLIARGVRTLHERRGGMINLS